MNGAHEGATQDARPSAKRKWMEDRCAMMDANVLLLALCLGMGVGVVDGYVRRFKRYGTINESYNY